VGVLHKGSMITSDPVTNQNLLLRAPGAGGAAGPAGRQPSGGGVDGNPGATGSVGTATALLMVK
jgi:hypothetical protein